MSLVACGDHPTSERQAPSKRADPNDATVSAALRADAERCRLLLPRATEKFSRLRKRGAHLEAFEALEGCSHKLDTALQQDATDSHLKGLRAGLADQRLPAIRRIALAQQLRAAFPAEKQVTDEQLQALNTLHERQTAKADADRRRREGVSIGMSRQEVLQSSWGRPEKVNRTTTSSRVTEQWVYPGGYLYFTDGVLDAIQN